jgi:hypothetical protein
MMLGTFSPQAEPYTYAGEEETTPAGMFARGSYSAKLKVTHTLIKFNPNFALVITSPNNEFVHLFVIKNER